MNPKPIILDISEWQVPSQIHYDVLSRQIGGVIVRIQYGSNYEDKHYRTHLAAFQKYNVPVAVYAWVRGTSIADMEKEASDFLSSCEKLSADLLVVRRRRAIDDGYAKWCRSIPQETQKFRS